MLMIFDRIHKIEQNADSENSVQSVQVRRRETLRPTRGTGALPNPMRVRHAGRFNDSTM